MSIAHSQKVLADLGKIAVIAVDLAKHGAGLGSVHELLSLLGDFKDLAKESQSVLPELKSLEPQDAADLAASCYDLLKSIVDLASK